MKHCFFCLFLLSLLCISNTKAQTNANIAGPENVLVVYKNNSGISDSVMQYYTNARNISGSNILGITLPDTAYFNGDRVILIQNGEVIKRDASCSDYNSYGWCTDTSAWKYYKEYIADPIAYHLNNITDPNTGQYLKDQIRYIVLCKGIPLKIMSGDPYWLERYHIYGINISVDGLLCLLKTNSNNNGDITSLYYSSIMDNPYDQNDQDFDFNHRFKSNHYATGNWKLAYLVSRLDGQNYEDIELMIDRGVNADKSGEGVWILDGDPWGYLHTTDVTATKNKLQNLGFNYLYDTGDSCITTSNYPVIGYTSQGLHTGENYPHWPRLDSGYVHNQLQFQYLNGAIFMTFESFNYISNYSVYGRDKHGLLAEFVTRRPSENWAGTGGTGHTWEPYQSGAVKNQYYFPAYAMGYSIVDAAYLGMPYIGWQNIVVGDPLTTIAWGKQAITDNLTMTGTNLVTGEITVPLVNSITLDDDAVVNFKHNGFITGDGYIYTASNNYTLSINDWEKALFRSEEDNHPKLIWGAYPGIPSLIDGYKIYRKWYSDNYELIYLVNTSTLEFIDEDVEIYNPEENENQKEAEYYITAIIEDGSSIVESEPSNVIDYWVNKVGKKGTSNNRVELNYTLAQNYPNPFNPTTQIKYSIKENGLVSIRVFDVLGKEVAVLIKEEQPAGEHRVNFDGSNLSSGIYFYTITAKDFHQTKKMLLVK